MVFVHFVEIEGLSPEPVPFPLHIHQTRFLLGLDPLHVRFLLQISHILLNYVHLLLKGLQKVILMLIHYLLNELARILKKKQTNG